MLRICFVILGEYKGDQIFVRYVGLVSITRLKYYVCALQELCANLIIFYTNSIMKSIELSYCIVDP